VRCQKQNRLAGRIHGPMHGQLHDARDRHCACNLRQCTCHCPGASPAASAPGALAPAAARATCTLPARRIPGWRTTLHADTQGEMYRGDVPRCTDAATAAAEERACATSAAATRDARRQRFGALRDHIILQQRALVWQRHGEEARAREPQPHVFLCRWLAHRLHATAEVRRRCARAR
jgi:hypothetical protein